MKKYSIYHRRDPAEEGRGEDGENRNRSDVLRNTCSNRKVMQHTHIASLLAMLAVTLAHTVHSPPPDCGIAACSSA